jgi:type IV pilus assembly protein PilE
MQKGFSLIELLIVMGIIGILALIGYPNYHQFIIRSHRSDGQTALLQLANRLEHYFSLHHTYQTATIGLGKPSDVLDHELSAGGWYKLVIVNSTEKAYDLEAVPQGSQALNDSCQTLTLNSNGDKGIRAAQAGLPPAPLAQCWS